MTQSNACQCEDSLFSTALGAVIQVFQCSEMYRVQYPIHQIGLSVFILFYMKLKWSKMIQDDSQMILDVPRCSQIILEVSICSQMFLDVSRCSQMSLDVPRCSQMFLDNPRCFQMFLDVSRCSQMFPVVPRYSQMFLDVPRCS